jgi:L-alanine-DL-glutamate epimerase-like enolase superfamily enzyme
VSDYEQIAGLELLVDAVDLERGELEVTSGFKRVTTTVRISGRGVVGEGEDVTYEADHHDGFTSPDLSGTWTFDDFSQRLDSLDLAGYRRWAFESAALDLALRQAGTSLGKAVGREYRAVRFVVSTREDIERYLAVQPTLEFKVDPTSEWSRALIDELAATGRIRVTDLKGYYRGTVVDQPADPRLYRDVVEGFPDAVIEDAAFTDETRPILEAAADRLSFDAPIHSVDDVQALEVEPRWLNIKPSRFGSVRRLLDTIAYAEEHGITLYGGGQFELGIGRSHIQAFASVYYADSANDVAPSLYNEPQLPDDAPASPLLAPSEPQGLAFSP